MQRISAAATILAVCTCMLALAGCGDSTPLPADDISATNYTPSTGTFAEVPDSSGNALAIDTCNLDAVNDKPAGSDPLPHESTATFSGWAADAKSGGVPAGLRLVLKGAQDYAVNVATGFPRPDVAKANNHAGWASAGYVVKADLSSVAPGTYTPMLEFSMGGKPMRCVTQRKLIIQ